MANEAETVEKIVMLDLSEDAHLYDRDVEILIDFTVLDDMGKAKVMRELVERSGTQNLGQALAYVNKAVKENKAEGHYLYALHLKYGLGVTRDEKQMLISLKKAADMGYAEAQYQLAWACIKGLGQQADLKKGLEWMEKAANQGHLKSQFDLSRLYPDEKCKELRDEKKARVYLIKAAEQGHAWAQFELALALLHGDGFTKDVAKAQIYLKSSSESDNRYATAALALMAQYGIDQPVDKKMAAGYWSKINMENRKSSDGRYYHYHFKERMMHHYARLAKDISMDESAWFKTFSARENSLDADDAYALAICYMQGYGVKSNLEKAEQYLRIAAELGHAHAQFSQGFYFYANSNDYSKHKEGMLFYNRAAKQGHVYAMQSLASCYLTRYDNGSLQGEPDYPKAVYWFKKAIELDSPMACHNLAYLAHRGWGMPKDYKMASEYFLRAAEGGIAQAWFTLGQRTHLDEEGNLRKGVTQDARKEQTLRELSFYEKGAELGNVRCMYELGIALLKRLNGIPADPARGVYWLEQVYELHRSREAATALGEAYEQGTGVPVDLMRTLQYYETASDLGSGSASFKLGIYFFRGTAPIKQDYEKAQFYFERNIAQDTKQTNVSQQRVMTYIQGRCRKIQDINRALDLLKDSWFGQSIEVYLFLQHLAKVDWEGFPVLTTEQMKALEQKVNKGDAKAAHHLSVAYLRGDGSGKTESDKAWTYLKKAVDLGSTDALVDMGLYYELDVNGEKSPAKSFHCFKQAFEKDKSNAEAYLFASLQSLDKAREAYGEGNIKGRRYFSQKATEYGSAAAAYYYSIELGKTIYQQGGTIKPSQAQLAESAAMLEKSADAGFIPAMVKLCRLNEINKNPDAPKSSFYWLTRLAEKDIAFYVYTLSNHYKRTVKDEKKARELLLRAKDLGQPNAMGDIGYELYRQGEVEDASLLFKKAYELSRLSQYLKAYESCLKKMHTDETAIPE